MLQAATIKNLHSPELLTNFVFLQFSGDRLWYYRLVTAGSIDSNVRCVVQKYGSPVGNISPITMWAYDIRWVHNIHCLYTAIIRKQRNMKCKTELLFT